MRFFLPLAGGVKIYKDAAALDPHRICRDTILFETKLADSTAPVKFPIMPRTDDIIAIQPALAKWAANVVAYV
jgi:hypothetical protein